VVFSSVLSGIVALFPGIILVEHFGGKWVNISEVWVGAKMIRYRRSHNRKLCWLGIRGCYMDDSPGTVCESTSIRTPLEYGRGKWNCECRGEIRRYSQEHQWRRRLTGPLLTLRCESVGSKETNRDCPSNGEWSGQSSTWKSTSQAGFRIVGYRRVISVLPW